MADMLSIGVSGLLAFRRSLDTTGNNISNANTEGYSRQRVDLVTSPSIGAGYGFIGTGVTIASVRRVTDDLVNSRVQSDASTLSRLDVFSGYASRVDSLLSDTSAGLSQPLKGFYDAANALAQNPTSTAARQALIGSADTLATRTREVYSQLDSMRSEINTHIRSTVDEINNLTQSIADLNNEIALNYGQFDGQPPNDLLDKRDKLLQDLSSRIGLSTVAQSDGSINVFAGSGQALVVGNQSTDLQVQNDRYNSGSLDIVYGANGATITRQISGGSLGGYLDVRRESIDPALADLGKLAVGVAQSVNTQHAQGMDLYGDLGGDFFVPPQGIAYGATGNTGTASVAVGYGDLTQLQTNDYVLSYDGANWSMKDANSGSVAGLSGIGTAADPLVGPGISMVVSGSPAAGDSFLVRPTALAAASMDVAISDPARVAAASPVRVSADLANTGSASADAPVVTDVTDPNLLNSTDITFTSPTTYQIGGTSFPYTSGQPITANGWSVTISGTPAAGDVFTVAAAGSNNGDNSNAKALAALSDTSIFGVNGGSATESHIALVTTAGLRAQQSGMQRDSQQAISDQTLAQRDSVSGVNLDEEASDLIRYQQAYQAAAQVITVANTIFQTLIRATGG